MRLQVLLKLDPMVKRLLHQELKKRDVSLQEFFAFAADDYLRRVCPEYLRQIGERDQLSKFDEGLQVEQQFE